MSIGRYIASDAQFSDVGKVVQHSDVLDGTPIYLLDGSGVTSVPLLGGTGTESLLGKLIPASSLVEDATYGYTVEAGASGVSRDGSNNLVLTADNTNPEVRLSFGSLFPVRFLYRDWGIVCSVAVTSPDYTGTQDARSRVGFRYLADGDTTNATVETAAEARTAANWGAAAYSTNDSGTNSDIPYSTYPVADVRWIRGEHRQAESSQIKYGQIEAHVGTHVERLDGTRTSYLGGSLALIGGAYSGFDWLTDKTQGSSFELFASQGDVGGDTITLTVEYIWANVWKATLP